MLKSQTAVDNPDESKRDARMSDLLGHIVDQILKLQPGGAG
jgi:hypothetical protein